MSKRLANSPAERLPAEKKVPTTPELTPKFPSLMPKMPPKNQAEIVPEGSLFKFEVTSINGKNFYGTLAECEIIKIWEKVLGRSKEEIFAMSYNRSLTRNFKVTFKLHQEILPSDVYPEPTFTYYRKSRPDAEEDDALVCKIIGYSSIKPAELGQPTKIFVKTNDFAVTPGEINAWLSKFGSVKTPGEYEVNSVGVRSDVYGTVITLVRHIPEFLPISGRKIQISYAGIPKACNNCYQTGHLKRSCKAKKSSWLNRVQEIHKSGEFEDELFGGWIAILDREFA